MKKHFLILILLFQSAIVFTQKIEQFKQDFTFIVERDLTDEEMSELFNKYRNLLTPHSDITQLTMSVMGEKNEAFPLSDFKFDNLYLENIEKLIFSSNPNKRSLANLIIASSNDKQKESVLLTQINNDTHNGCKYWAAMALMYMGSTRTTPIFDFIVENENFGDSHMIPLFFQLNTDSLQNTAYIRIDSKNIKAKALAAQLLSKTPLNSKSETLLKKAITDWPIEIKGYAIFSVKELKIGNLLSILQPLLDSTTIRSICLEALVNSPTKEDREYIIGLTKKDTIFSEQLLNAFYKSNNIENVKYWLQLIPSKKVPENYYFSIFQQPLMQSNDVLNDIHQALPKINNPNIIHLLIRSLSGRNDTKSTEILIAYLQHENSSVRYWAAHSLKKNMTNQLKEVLPKIVKDTKLNNVAIIELIIENEFDKMQDHFEWLYSSNKTGEIHKGAFNYLTTYPLPKYKELFYRILCDKKSDYPERRGAALGLGKLKDTEAIDLIIEVINEQENDYNKYMYLVALGMIHGEKSKNELEKYKQSSEQIIQVYVNETLKNW